MQFDRTRIPIQERTFLQLMDLSLRVAREHLFMLVMTSLAGALPFFLLNDWLLGDRITRDSLDAGWDYSVYFFTMPVLIWWQMPLASVFATLYLGQVLFLDRFNMKKMLREALASLPQLILYQVVLRGLCLLLCVLTMWIPHFAFPYLNEIILLERNPLQRKGIHGLSTWLRRQRLHSQYGVDLLGRWLASMIYGTLLVASLWLAMISIRFYMVGGGYDEVIYRYLLPVAMWVVVGYFNVVRFLSYLDLRIRNEGWEIDLRLRAEGQRLTRQLTR